MAYLRIKNASLEEKAASVPEEPTIPPILEPEFDKARLATKESVASPHSAPAVLEHKPEDAILYFAPSSKADGPWVTVTDVHRRLSSPESLSLEDEVRECFQILIGIYLYLYLH